MITHIAQSNSSLILKIKINLFAYTVLATKQYHKIETTPGPVLKSNFVWCIEELIWAFYYQLYLAEIKSIARRATITESKSIISIYCEGFYPLLCL